jgi:hypothetical protein
VNIILDILNSRPIGIYHNKQYLFLTEYNPTYLCQNFKKNLYVVCVCFILTICSFLYNNLLQIPGKPKFIQELVDFRKEKKLDDGDTNYKSQNNTMDFKIPIGSNRFKEKPYWQKNKPQTDNVGKCR